MGRGRHLRGEGPTRFASATLRKAGGLDFVLDNYMTEEKHMIETMPGGVASLDYNNDGCSISTSPTDPSLLR
jgi:hypothetical protein